MTDTELSSGITSLSEALALSIGLLDGDVTTTTTATPIGKADSNEEDTKLPPPNNKQLTPIEKSISILTKLQTQISQSNLISNNELLDDISTSTLELLCVDYQLGRAFLLLPTYFPQPQSADNNDGESNGRNESSLTSSSTAISPSKLRKQNVIRAMEYYHSYLKRLEQLSENNNNKDDMLLSDDTIKEYHTYLDMDDMNSSDIGTIEGDNGRNEVKLVMNPSQVREMKIQRYKRKKALTTQTQLLQSKLQQRTRLNISNEETFDNHNYESLIRTLYIEQLKLYAEESLEEMYSSRNELDMLDMSIKMEETRMSGMGDGRMNRMSSHAAAAASAAQMSRGSNNEVANGPHGGRQQSQQPMSMTQITQNPLTGELEYTKQTLSNGQLKSTTSTPPSSSLSQIPQRQNIKEGIFKPSWNLPTMSLDELADRERSEAIQRSEQQKLAEEQAIYKPKRYNQLVKDGMEDNAELVEASAKLDREWDDWKEENPRGSGNKMSERGDRNF